MRQLTLETNYQHYLMTIQILNDNVKEKKIKNYFLPSNKKNHSCVQSLDHDRIASLEREMASLKGQVTHSFPSPINDQDLNRSLSTKKKDHSSSISARVLSPNRGSSTRKFPNEESSGLISTNDGPFSRSLPQVTVSRSKSFNNGTTYPPMSPPTNSNEEASFLRSYKSYIEQVLRKEAPAYTDVKVPNYTSIDDVMKANEQLLVENERLRSELNRLKTESILLLRSMRTANGIEPNLGNERVRKETMAVRVPFYY